nr:enoyl-CoA hydratase-related protein [Micromonospora sp. DSM 115978]
MAEAVGVAEADPDVRVIRFVGSGGCFTAGNDLAAFLEGPSLDLDGPTIAFMKALATSTKVVVAQVDGPAVGIGTTMLMHCDLVYATARSKFALPFVNLGIVPEFGASTILPRLLGRQAAADALLFGEPFSAAKALDYGLVTEVLADADALAERVAARLEALVANPPLALAATRRLLRPAGDVAV